MIIWPYRLGESELIHPPGICKLEQPPCCSGTKWFKTAIPALPGWPDLDPKWVKLTTNGTNPGIFFQIKFSTFGSVEPNVLNLIWKKSPICGQFDPLWVQIRWASFAHSAIPTIVVGDRECWKCLSPTFKAEPSYQQF